MSQASPASQTPKRKPMAVPGVWPRLRIYLIGIGIGLVLLGSFHVMKRLAEQREQAAAQEAAKRVGQPTTPPTTP